MSAVPLSDDETVAVFTDRAITSVREDLSKDDRVQFLKRLYELLSDEKPASYFIEKAYKGCDELQQLRAGDVLRGYCRLVERFPEKNVLFVFEVNRHDHRNLTRFDSEARTKVRELESLTTAGELDTYLDDQRALTEADVSRLLEELSG